MQCARCGEVVFSEAAQLPTYQIQLGMEGTLCPACGLCVGLNHAGVWVSIQDSLTDSSQQDGWSPAECLQDRAVHWVLAQVVYRSCDTPDAEHGEVPFDTPDPTDLIYLLWASGQAVGFCTLKPKGAVVEPTFECYSMLTLDTVYIRSTHRRRGHVTKLLRALANTHSDVGFSQPISDSMTKVLCTFLQKNPDCRRRFWEINGAGTEGCRKLLWFILRKNSKNSTPI